MPVLDLGQSPPAALRELITIDQATGFRTGSTNSVVVLGIGAAMHHPGDEEARRAYLVACYAAILAETQAERDRYADGTPEWAAQERAYRYWQRAFDEAGGFVPLRHAKQRDQDDLPKPSVGSYAGHLLLRILERAENSPAEATVNKACEYVEKAVVLQKLPASRASIMAAWGDFKAVAHLWAASALLGFEARRFAEHEIPLGQFLATAEELRRHGEDWHPGGRRISKSKPVLDPQRMWHVDPSIELPTVVLSLGKLSSHRVVQT